MASALSINDKFPNITKRNKHYHDGYKYLGIRSTSNNAFIGKYKRDFLVSFTRILSENKRISALNNALCLLELPKRFKFSFKISTGMSNILHSAHMAKDLSSYKNALREFISEKNKLNKLDENYLNKVVRSDRAIAEIYSFIQNSKNGIDNLEYIVDISDPYSNQMFISDCSVLMLMSELKIITIKDFSFVNDFDEPLSFSLSSSGQFHILISIIGIASEIDDNTLLLIDEPEISLHPTWQIKYIEILKHLLSPFTDCHTIICTHSHFLVSSMTQDNGEVLHARKIKGEIYFERVESDVFGWSPENILYNIFGMTSTRNSYFESDLRKIISAITNGMPKENLIEPLSRIKKFNITEDDPLKLVIARAEKYISEDQ